LSAVIVANCLEWNLRLESGTNRDNILRATFKRRDKRYKHHKPRHKHHKPQHTTTRSN
jgi:hypothetical protein